MIIAPTNLAILSSLNVLSAVRNRWRVNPPQRRRSANLSVAEKGELGAFGLWGSEMIFRNIAPIYLRPRQVGWMQLTVSCCAGLLHLPKSALVSDGSRKS